MHCTGLCSKLAVDLLTERGFQLLDVPLMVRSEAMRSTGFFPLGLDQTYRIAGEDQWLVGTSEVPLVAYYSGEIVDVTNPIRLAAVSVCFRNEVGSAGRTDDDYRVVQNDLSVDLCRTPGSGPRSK